MKKRTIAVLAVSGCAAGVAAVALISATSAPPLAAPASLPPIALEHVHEVLADRSGGWLIGAHTGIYEVAADEGVRGPIAGLDFDPMGLTNLGSLLYASGHPGAISAPGIEESDLGLIQSEDGGETWRTLSLAGQVDFHSLTVTMRGAIPFVYGLSSDGELLVSGDGGVTWSTRSAITARDLLSSGSALLATTPDGLAISYDDGMTFAIDASAPSLYLLAPGRDDEIIGVDTQGTIWSGRIGDTWERGGSVPEPVEAIGANGDTIVIAGPTGLRQSSDSGVTWSPLAPGLASSE